jgi:hypothetical protein
MIMAKMSVLVVWVVTQCGFTDGHNQEDQIISALKMKLE